MNTPLFPKGHLLKVESQFQIKFVWAYFRICLVIGGGKWSEKKKRRGSTSECKKKKWRSITMHLSQTKIHKRIFVRVFLSRPGWKISGPTNLPLPPFAIQTSNGEGFSLPPTIFLWVFTQNKQTINFSINFVRDIMAYEIQT